MSVEKFVFRSGIVISFLTLLLLVLFVPSYIQRISQIKSYLERQNAEFEKLEREAWKILKEAKRTKRQYTPFEPEDLPFAHLPTPIIPLRRPTGCRCNHNNDCPGKKAVLNLKLEF
jgi:hypothetical protein